MALKKAVEWKYELEMIQTPISKVFGKISVTVGNEIVKHQSTHNHECIKKKTASINAVQYIKEIMTNRTTTLGACQ